MKNNIKKSVAIASAVMLLVPSSSMAMKHEYTNNEYKVAMENTIKKNNAEYIAVKDFGEMVKKPVQWDSKNRAIYIGKKPAYNLEKEISLEDFISEYNIYSKGTKNYGTYKKGFKDMQDRYNLNKNIKFKILNKEVLAKNINLDSNIYPVYNEFSKVRFSLGVSEPSSITNVINGEKTTESVKLNGGAPRINAVRKTPKGYEYINLVSKIDYIVDRNTKTQPEKFEVKLKDVYALGLPENAIDIEFVRNNEEVRVYLDGERFYLTNDEGISVKPINVNNKFYIPIQNISDVLKKDAKEKGVSPSNVFKEYALGDYEKSIADKIEQNNVYMYSPRTKENIQLKNIVNIPDGDIKLNKGYSKIVGYHASGIGVFSGSASKAKDDDKYISGKYNSGMIYNGNKVIYDSNAYFKSKGIGENVNGFANKSKLKSYMPSNIVYFEVDVKGLDTVSFNNFNAINMEFIK